MSKKIGLFFIASMLLVSSVFATGYTMINNSEADVQVRINFCGSGDGCIVHLPAGGHKTADTPYAFIKGSIFIVKPIDEKNYKGKECTLSKEKDNIVLRVRSSKLSLSGKTLTCDVE